MNWKYNDEDFTEIPKGMEGFVYLITNLTNNKKYVGKKHFWSRQKDKKTGRRRKKESNWKSYFGSCIDLTEDIKNIGSENFLREILYICPHKKSMSYYETMEQFKRDVLMTDEYYNTNIEGRFFVGERSGIYEVVLKNDKFKDIKRKQMTGENNPSKRPEVREKLRVMHTGEGNPMYGKKLTKNHKEKLFSSRKRKITDGTNIWDSVSSYIKSENITWKQFVELIENNILYYVDGKPMNRKKEKNISKHNIQMWKCLVTEFVSTASGLTRYQKHRNIDITLREKLELLDIQIQPHLLYPPLQKEDLYISKD